MMLLELTYTYKTKHTQYMPCIPARSKSLTETNLGVNTPLDLVVKQDIFVHIKSPCMYVIKG